MKKLDLIRRKARALLKKHDLLEIPVNLEDLAKRLGVTIVKEDLDEEVSGLLLIRDNKVTIGINKNHHPNRQRFTLGHELGHYLLHSDQSTVFVDGDVIIFRDTKSGEGEDWNEVEANNFAAELLMPTPLVRSILSEKKLDLSDDIALRRLASRFGVSEQAFSIQLTKLDMISI